MVQDDKEILHHLQGIHTRQEQLQKILSRQEDYTLRPRIWALGRYARMIPEEIKRKFTEIDMEELAKARDMETLFTPTWAEIAAKQATTEKAIQQVNRAIQAYNKEEKEYE